MQMKSRIDESHKSMAEVLVVEVEHRILDVQTVRRDNVSLDHIQRILKLLGQLLVAHDLDGLGHLSKELFQAAEQANQRSLISISHFTVQGKRLRLASGITYQLEVAIEESHTRSLRKAFPEPTYTRSP